MHSDRCVSDSSMFKCIHGMCDSVRQFEWMIPTGWKEELIKIRGDDLACDDRSNFIEESQLKCNSNNDHSN